MLEGMSMNEKVVSYLGYLIALGVETGFHQERGLGRPDSSQRARPKVGSASAQASSCQIHHS